MGGGEWDGQAVPSGQSDHCYCTKCYVMHSADRLVLLSTTHFVAVLSIWGVFSVPVMGGDVELVGDCLYTSPGLDIHRWGFGLLSETF